MKELPPRRVTVQYTPEEMTEIETIIGLLKSKIKTPFPMTNKEFDALPKMADAKRKEVGDKLAVFKGNNGFFSDSTAVPYITTSLEIFDQSKKISGLLAEVDNKHWRNGDISGFQAMTQMTFCDTEARLKASVPVAEAVEAVNQLDDLKVTRKTTEVKQTPSNKPDAKK